MAIQFRCAACGQPIEIDDEWGGKAVACPFCRKTVSAPAHSTYATDEVRAARPLAGRGGFEPIDDDEPLEFGERQAAARGNAAAVWAIALTCLSVACMVVSFLLIAAHPEDMNPLMQMAQEGKSNRELQEAFLEQFKDGVPGWLILAMLSVMGAGLLWLAGLICGLLALRRRPRRGLAIASLGLSVLMLLLMLVPNR